MSETPIRYIIDLPFPISANRLWRRGGLRIHLSAEYAQWKAAADGAWLLQKPPGRPVTLGAYELSMVLDRRCGHGRVDGDNLLKCVNDWLQRVELVHNDKHCERWAGAWGDAPTGCRVMIEGQPYEK